MINMIATTAFDLKGTAAPRPGEKPEVDLYADLFAAFFTVPPPDAKPLQLVVDGEQVSSGRPENIADPNLPGTIPSGISPTGQLDDVPRDMPALELWPRPVTAPIPVDARPDPISDARPPVDLIGPPLGDVKMDPKLDITPPDDDPPGVIDLPEFNPPVKLSTRGPVGVILPPNGDHMPIDTIEVRDYDHPVEAEVLEIPPVVTPVRAERDEPILDVQPAVREQVSLQDVQAAFGFSAFGNKVNSEPRKAVEPNTRDKATTEIQPDPKPETTYLETFATNVLTDTRPREALRTTFSTSKEIKIESIFEESIRPVEKKQREDDGGAEFSFESGLGETAIDKPAPSQFADAKLKRLIFDQVGSNLTDLALNQKEGVDQRVIKIRLKPAELGTVEITLAKNSDGVIDAHFRTENPHTQHILNETLAQLRDSLESSGMKVGNLDTSCGTSFSGAGGGDERSPVRTIDIPRAERTTFDESVRPDEPKSSRLLNLRA